jgi:hypothetical protein
MATINHPILGRKYRRQITMIVMVGFLFCRSFLPTKSIKTVYSNKVFTPETQTKKPNNEPVGLQDILLAGAAMFIIYEIFQSEMPSTPSSTYSPDQGYRDEEAKEYERSLEKARYNEVERKNEEEKRRQENEQNFQEDRRAKENEQ